MSIKVPTEAPLCMLASRLLCIRLTTQRNGHFSLLEKDGEALKGIQVSFRKGATPSQGTDSPAPISLFFLGFAYVSIATNVICGWKLSCPLFIPISHKHLFEF